MKENVVIIGGGVGGLFTGAFLAKNGVKVTVLEKNHTVGGGLQCFTRNGATFETGMHVTGGFGEGGILTKICNYLGILDSLDIQKMPDECTDEVFYASTGERFRIPSGRAAFTEYFSRMFPAEAQGIWEYVDELHRLSEEEPLLYLREYAEKTEPHSERFDWAADRLINHYVKDPKLRELLAYLNPLYGGMRGHTPAYVHALINVMHMNGAFRFAGGSQQLADALKDLIEVNGGEVHTSSEISRIGMTDRNIDFVETKRGSRHTADRYISSIHPAALLPLLPESAFPRAFVRRLNEIPLSHSAFSVYIKLKPGIIPYIGHTCHYMPDYGNMWDRHEATGPEWPRAFMYMTPPEKRQGDYAKRLLVHCAMDYSETEKWADTATGRRGPEYEEWKWEHAERILDTLETIIPGLRDAVADVHASTPLTIRDYYHTKRGAIFGYRKDCGAPMLSRLSVNTKIKNLLLAGQNINLHGICGTPITSIITAEAILGHNRLVKDINDAHTLK